MSNIIRSGTFFILLLSMISCHKPMKWPESPLYDFTQNELADFGADDRLNFMKSLEGHYAHFDVVAYEDTTTRSTMRTFIVSYGYTDFYIENGKLMQSDRFVSAVQKLSKKNAKSWIRDEAVEAIKPRVQEVELTFNGESWEIYRPATPSLLGVNGDSDLSLEKNLENGKPTDPDKDGNPGVSVHIQVGKFFKGEVYIARREIFSNYLKLHANGTLSGYVEDRSEQVVLGASKKILEQPSNSIQIKDIGLNPVLLIPIDPEIDSAKELMRLRDELFPAEPEFQ